MAITLIKDKNHQIIKRDGRIEPYTPEKSRQMLLWATDNREHIVNEIMEDINIRIYDKIKIEKLFDEFINTVANKISSMYPIYDDIARNMFIQKIYKEIWGIKRDEYPDYLEVLKKGIDYKIYDKEVLDTFTEDELKEIGEYIKPERDFIFTFGGLNLFIDKYSAKYTKTKHLELPQHVYMRVAIDAFFNDPMNRIAKIKEKYDSLSLHEVTDATPKMINALKPNGQDFSCTLMRPDDDAASINYVSNALGMFSKYGSGLGVDMSLLRCTGSAIGKSGTSNGPVPFIQQYQGTVSAFNQLGVREGACAVYCSWWHYDIQDIVMLKDAGGKDSERARKLKYVVSWGKLLSARFLADDYITLFDPKETPELMTLVGDEFKEKYEEYETKNIKKKRIKARELAFIIAKVRSETGNIYIFFRDNVNIQRMGKGFITQSNLCTEVMLETEPLKVKSEKMIYDYETKKDRIVQEIEGDVALCNLSSNNLIKWYGKDLKEKIRSAYNLLCSMDNVMESSYYPIKAGESYTLRHRPVGVGVSNYANLLATLGYSLADENSFQTVHELFEELLWCVLYASTEIAKERGKYELYEGSSWSKGILPFEKSLLKDDSLNFPLKMDWDIIRDRIQKYGVRFEYHLAIAPTQTSGLAISSTEGTEPIRELKITKTGTYTLPFLAPNIKQNREFYTNAFDIPNETLLKHAAIRQKFLDQGQSINLYYKVTDSSSEIIKDIIYAESLGIKSLYYLNPYKAEVKEECDSCSS